MSRLRLVYFSATASEIPSLSTGTRIFCEHQPEIELSVHARSQTQLFDQARCQAFVREALKADVCIISLHGGKKSFPAFDQLEEALHALPLGQQPLIHVQPTGGDEDSIEAAREFSTAFGRPLWDEMHRYLLLGGSRNFEALLILLYNHAHQGGLAYPPPQALPDDGIYHPDYSDPPSLKTYLAERVDPAKPTLGLWFYQIYWINNNLSFIDAIIRSIEAQGANVLPVFHLRYKDAQRQNRAADGVSDYYFKNADGSPRIQALLNPLLFSLTLVAPDFKELLPSLNVPFLQALCCSAPYAHWLESVQGLPSMDVAYAAAQPEFDGALITVPVATREQEETDPLTGALLARYQPIPERVDKLVRLALNWARLGQTPAAERRVAIIFHHYPPRNDRIGCAAGLDSFASVNQLLLAMREQGYQIEQEFEDGNKLAHALRDKMTCDRRWLTPEQMAARSEAQAGPDHYQDWHDELPENIREKMRADWGDMPGELFVHEKNLHFAGLRNGNVFLTIQPPRGYLEQIDKVLHDMYLSPPHHYLAQYRYIRDVFKAHAVIHVGKHGSLEWLPGKALGLSGECYPDLAIMELPNIYPYIINDPGEGTQAKRRSYCCIIDHLTPAFTNADLHDDLARVQGLVDEYMAAQAEDPGKQDILRPMLWQAVCAADLHQDLAMDEATALADFNAFLDKLHSYVEEIGDTMINDGLHVMGLPPEGERLQEFVTQLTRLPNGDVPSLREALIGGMGYDYDEVLAQRGSRQDHFGNRSGAELLREAHRQALALVQGLAAQEYQPESAAELAQTLPAAARPAVTEALAYIASQLVPNIGRCREEIDATLAALAGGFVRPGPSGAPSRGQADILPTGRNFYSVDPNKIPSPAAWEVGVRLGDALIARYLAETGTYPESIGILVYGTVTMRTKGDDLAEILYLMGLKPVWQKGSGNVCGLEVIPLAELGRPRLDVVPRISGFFRDSFPNLVELIDDAARMVAALEEKSEMNFLRRNVLRDMAAYRKEGLSEEEAFREATFRVFGCPPGTYGAGVSELVESKNWQTQEDLGNNYIRYSSHAYGQGSYGAQRPDAYRRQLARMDVTVKNEDSREYDMMSCTDYYNYYGGMIVAVKTVRGHLPFALMGDSSDPKRVKMRTTQEEAKHVLRSRLTNPKWLEGMKRHGYKGAGDISHVMDIVLGWDATAEVIDDWMYSRIAQSYALDPAMRDWMHEVNPHALQNILDKLLEAISRGMWRAEPEMEEQLRNAYLETEAEIEEWSE
ncbi:MAG: cobaltochelatase subunit CobN [Desulfobulbaceae bacterium]|nr:cobaltochelatase subunit CobN [Desulfobulbaceae bacterium]